jgi:hypothetical protein
MEASPARFVKSKTSPLVGVGAGGTAPTVWARRLNARRRWPRGKSAALRAAAAQCVVGILGWVVVDDALVELAR